MINQYQRICGKIIIESKRTKNFNAEWIDKLISDQRRVQADIAVLVSETMPKDIEGFGQVKGVWVCNYKDFKSLIYVLREIVLKTSAAQASQENKGEKMELLYGFLTSEEFRLQITGIIDGFKQMKEDLEREKNSMRMQWKKREKHLEIVISNTIDMYGSIRGIAGSSLPTIENLELPEGDDDLDGLL